MVRVGPDTYKRLQNDASCIRNICIVAHVDHGKTSLSDSLLASNGIISQRLAGKIRYLDSRPDEQVRGITMESSAISLYFRVLHKQEGTDEPLVNEHLINLIDSPGHIDFSSEVSAASRLCDGAVVLVDVVEGVCSQTITVLRQCWVEKLKPVLVLNKMDRLITELQMTPQETYLHLNKIIEQVNSVLGSFFAGERQLDDYSWREQLKENENAEFTERDDSDIYFHPKNNNVIFASAVDGWGFNIGQLAKFYEQKLGAKRENLQKVLWGDFYLDPKTKKIINNKGLKGRNLKPLFTSLILDNIWKIYENIVIARDDEKISKITDTLNIKLLPRDLRSKDDKQLLRNVMGQWLPVSTAVLLTVIEKLPSPVESQKNRLDTILKIDTDTENVDKHLLDSMSTCDRNGPACAYVSKIISIPREELPVIGSAEVSPDQIMERSRKAREEALKAAKRAEMLENMGKLDVKGTEAEDEDLYKRAKDTVITPDIGEKKQPVPKLNDTFEIVTEAAPAMNIDLGFEYEQDEDEDANLDGDLDFVPADIDPNDPLSAMFEYEEENPLDDTGVMDPFDYEDENVEDLFNEKDEVLIGFSRIYSGSLEVGQEICVLGPKYDPKNPTEHIQTTTITSLYLFMGKELVPLDYCPAGNIVGIGGLAGKVLKNGTLIENGINGVNLAGVNINSTPIVRVAVEPANPTEMGKLVRGLKLLDQADPCVEVYISDTGEHILCTAGELHLERCLNDLQDRFAGVEVTHSEPAIPYRETFISESDMGPPKNKVFGRGVVESLIGKYKIRLRTIPLENDITVFLDRHESSIRHIFGNNDDDSVPKTIESTILDRSTFVSKLEELISKQENLANIFGDNLSKVAALGPKRVGCNILVSENNLLGSLLNKSSGKFEFSDPIINGFQISVNEGPLAKEPVQGMVVVMEDIHEMTVDEISAIADEHYQIEIPNLSGRFINHTKDQIHESFLDWSPRIMWAIYTCDIQTSVEVLGKVYAVVQQRHGKIVSEEMKEGTPFFQIEAEIPVVEAFGLSEDIRKKTSGAAQPQLVFSGFECIDIDPFWVPTTEEELEELGDTADKENIARRHMNNIRRRKGLFVDEKVIQNAEKQRTLKRN
ncbi:similar to Saccharomyces cerevisiae YNL163C RIA1 Cytoplasmic GTPase involved in biogenesis of the 60S ribosome [Maudiozyma barnettii]|uniref:Ribosome assembly protein 1 n=1 Tax=Maudiozyma barnettii TaxID=61262 RepID=A0A8H2VEZ2_9SACH|nr:GTPase RIA1 [Kazachstania barnettii]CAB4253904.1 similar to Saccharomyces cerevisiae YNL163C RIA1 Cytoplasmic GTPase involved in biogenesis of the 60S ribosome [Kazachstania barnettii]CAD1781654.1 similar to Saccharomyces cerevisiae YNL163C RIA1 Cytoplasmic GTPase involved in biogenesis of the 60S ribosome [Kazachstania barnettii]